MGQIRFETVTELTRRPDKGHHDEGWFVYFGDVRVGHIGLHSGAPVDEPQWGWTCGFYPGCDPGQQTHGTGESFEEAKAGFEEAWNRLRAARTEAHFELWRQERDFTAWKYRMQEKGLKLPTQTKNGLARCFCGVEIELMSLGVDIEGVAKRPGDLFEETEAQARFEAALKSAMNTPHKPLMEKPTAKKAAQKSCRAKKE